METLCIIKGDPSMHGWHVTNPAHGGKVTCYKCGDWIYENEDHVIFEEVYFHEKCFNRYEHYYGLDKPLD